LIGAPLRIEVDVWIGVVRPARRHRLCAGEDAALALHLIFSARNAVLDRVRAEVKIVERAERLEEELRGADEVLGSRFARDPRFIPIRVVPTLTARAGE